MNEREAASHYEGESAGLAAGERRGAQRVDLDGAVEVVVAGMPALAGRVRNVSTQGLLLALPAELPLGAEARVVLEFDGVDVPLELRALVVRQTREASGPFPVRVGLVLIDPNAAAARRLTEIIFSQPR